jgi:anti-sigma factor RsiW
MSSDHLPQRELELLSAYIDGELKPGKARRLEARLRADARLREHLDKLQAVSRGMRALPQVKPPKSFILTPEMVGISPVRSGYPVLRLATALAAFAFVALVGVDLFTMTLSGAMPARSMDQVMAEAPAVAEPGFADAMKSEEAELEEEIDAAAVELLAEVEAPEEEAAGEGLALAEPAAEQEDAPAEGLALAEPAAEQEDAPAEERMVGESEAPAEPQMAIPETTISPADEAPPTYSATLVPEADVLANQVEPAEPLEVETFEQPERRSIPSIVWIRVVEAGLAILTLVLGGLTLRARKRSQ